MRNMATHQQALFPDLVTKFPSTRYQGSKAKLTDWIWEQIAGLAFNTCLDAFGGTGAIAYRLKQEGKAVKYNDLLRFNYYAGLALIENCGVRLDFEEVGQVTCQRFAQRVATAMLVVLCLYHTTMLGKPKNRIFYGWVIVAGASGIVSLIWGCDSTYGIFLPELATDLGWTKTTLSGAYSM
ncbi:unnamed protein product, partial [marine sediment metagenome]